ncbi:MAG: sulfite exporter TauE/SafE family protein [bacterium]
MSLIEIASLLTAACAAGAVNAIAGGGTLITFPTLILFGVPPLIANATSTLALVVGTVGSLYGYRKHIADVKPWFTTFIPVSIAGGWIGSLLLTRSSERVFTELVPYLVLFATVLFMLQGVASGLLIQKLGHANSPARGRASIMPALFFQFLVSIYGGYFGAGIGILMLATLGFMGFKTSIK